MSAMALTRVQRQVKWRTGASDESVASSETMDGTEHAKTAWNELESGVVKGFQPLPGHDRRIDRFHIGRSVLPSSQLQDS